MSVAVGRPVMTLRPCARRACRRMFPVAVSSSRIYCDEDCDELAMLAHKSDAMLDRIADALDVPKEQR